MIKSLVWNQESYDAGTSHLFCIFLNKIQLNPLNSEDFRNSLSTELKLWDYSELVNVGVMTSLTSLSASCGLGVDLEVEGKLPRGLRQLTLATAGWLGMTVNTVGFPEIHQKVDECVLAFKCHNEEAESSVTTMTRLLQSWECRGSPDFALQQSLVIGELEWEIRSKRHNPNLISEQEGGKDRRCVMASSYESLVKFVCWNQYYGAQFYGGGTDARPPFRFQLSFPYRRLSEAALKGTTEAITSWSA